MYLLFCTQFCPSTALHKQVYVCFFSQTLCGAVIGKQESRHFASKSSTLNQPTRSLSISQYIKASWFWRHILDPSQERNVLTFTMRDSPQDTINVTCWGRRQHIQELSESFFIGDTGMSIITFDFPLRVFSTCLYFSILNFSGTRKSLRSNKIRGWLWWNVSTRDKQVHTCIQCTCTLSYRSRSCKRPGGV